MERYIGSAERPDLSQKPNTSDHRPHATRHEIRKDAEGMNRDRGIDVSTDASTKVRLTQYKALKSGPQLSQIGLSMLLSTAGTLGLTDYINYYEIWTSKLEAVVTDNEMGF